MLIWRRSNGEKNQVCLLRYVESLVRAVVRNVPCIKVVDGVAKELHLKDIPCTLRIAIPVVQVETNTERTIEPRCLVAAMANAFISTK